MLRWQGRELRRAPARARVDAVSADAWNGVRFDAASPRGHVESYFAKLVDREGRRALWVKATILARGGGAPPVAEAWAIAFDRGGAHRAAKQVVPFADARFADDRLDVRVAGLALEGDRMRGVVEGGGTRVEIDLRHRGGDAPLVMLPALAMYEGRFPSSKPVTPHPDVPFFGHYAVDGARVEVDGWRGMQGHNWGRGHAPAYAWAHVNQWEGDEDAALEVVTARLGVRGALLPPVTVAAFVHRGARYLFHDVRSLARAEGVIRTRSYRFSAASGQARVSGELSADARDFVGLFYESPGAPTTHCLNSKIADGAVRFEVAGRPPVTLRTRAAALEIGTQEAGHGVRMLA